jgi:fibronectin-binding autotransporter adhesin
MSQRRPNLLRREYLALVACLLATCVAQAAVTITGQVDPADPLTWVGFYTDHHIGKTANGGVMVDGGSNLDSSVRMHVGFDAGVSGSVTVNGVGSTWTHHGFLYLGRSGSGTLDIKNGGVVNNVFGYLGYNSGSSGVVNVTGPGSQFINEEILEVGYYGAGALTIQDGARVSSATGGLANTGGSSAVVTVSGANSRWDMSEWLSVGGSGRGELKILSGAVVAVGSDTGVGGAAGSRILFDQGTLHTGGLLAGVSQLGGVGTVYTRGLVTDIALTFDASHGLEQQLRLNTVRDQDITLHLDISGAGNGYLGAGYKAVGSLNIADGVEVDSLGGYLGFHAGSQGTAKVTGSGSVWDNQRNLTVGSRGVGNLAIEVGARVKSLNTFVGAEGGAVGSAKVSGVGSFLDTSNEFSVGRSGAGTLLIEDGAAASNNAGYIGFYNGANGVANVTGVGSTWTNRGALNIGYGSTGTLTISDGATVSDTTGAIGWGYGSSGVVTVRDAGSAWTNNSGMAVGVGGAATLEVLNGGLVSNVNGDINGRGAPECTALVSGAGSAWVNSGNLRVGAAGKGTLTITDGGFVSVGSGGGAGDVTIGGAVGYNGTIHLQDRGVLRLHGGKISGTGAAAFNFNGGRLEGVGIYQVGAGLTQNGGVLAPGNSTGITTIVGSYILNSGALEIELLGSGGVAGTAFDRLVVNSGVTLGVNSQLNLLLGYAANVGDSFLIVDSKNSAPINGTFANDDALTAEFESLRYSFSLSYAAGTGNDIALTVASVALIGDYNGDGFVDAADYTVWQDAVGTSVAAYVGADGNGDGVVDDGDHAVWAAHYGASLEAAMAQAVPEPAGVVLAVVALVAAGRRRMGSGRSVS